MLCFFSGTPDGSGWVFQSPMQMAEHFEENWNSIRISLGMELGYCPAEMYVGKMGGKVFKSQPEMREDFEYKFNVEMLRPVTERYFSEAEALVIADVLAAPAGKSERSGRL